MLKEVQFFSLLNRNFTLKQIELYNINFIKFEKSYLVKQ